MASRKDNVTHLDHAAESRADDGEVILANKLTVVSNARRDRVRAALRPLADAIFAALPGCPSFTVLEEPTDRTVTIDVVSLPEARRGLLEDAIADAAPLCVRVVLLPGRPVDAPHDAA